MVTIQSLFKRFNDWLWCTAWEKATGELCDRCLLQKYKPEIERGMERVAAQYRKRYGCPQDYDDAQDFISHL